MANVTNNKYLLDEVMDMLDYNPLHSEIEISQQCMKIASESDDSQERLAYLNLAHKINSGFVDKIVPSKKAVEMHVELGEVDLPQVILANDVEEILIEDKTEED